MRRTLIILALLSSSALAGEVHVLPQDDGVLVVYVEDDGTRSDSIILRDPSKKEIRQAKKKLKERNKDKD